MDQPIAFSLNLFKQYWSELAQNYSVTNNDAALMFRAIATLITELNAASLSTPQGSLDSQIETIAACFPENLIPLCRSLAKACIEARGDNN